MRQKHCDRLYQLPIGSTFELALAVFSAGFVNLRLLA